MKKIWLKNYQKGVPETIDINEYQSLSDLFQKCSQKYAANLAFANLGTQFSYAEVYTKAKNFAAFLQQELKLEKGDRIAIMMPNLLQYPIIMFGAFLAGLIVVNINPLYTSSELIHVLNDSQAKAIVILANFAHVLEEALQEFNVKNILVTQIGDEFSWLKCNIVNFVVKKVKKMVPDYELPTAISYRNAMKQGAELKITPIELNHDDTAFLQYTGGTTGVAKGTMLSHGNMLANIMQLTAWVNPNRPKEQDVVITALPLYHIFSLTVNCLSFFNFNALNILITNPRDIPNFIKEIKNTKFSAITGVNTLLNALVRHRDFKSVDFSRLHLSMAGGMAVQESVANTWHEITGCPIVEGYGLTEASPVVTANPLNIEKYTGSVGLPLPSTDISIRDENNKELGINEEGELCVKGPQVMQGYWQNEEETKNVLEEDGWLHTGDIAKVDAEGFVYLIDRIKDMIIVSGFNVYPSEVEEAIAKHPGVLEVAVVGAPHEKSGEIVKAFVVKKQESLTEQELRNFCQDYLTRYKIPKVIEFKDELPKSNVGKILRRALRE